MHGRPINTENPTMADVVYALAMLDKRRTAWREHSAKWRADNYERAKEQQRAYYYRKKARRAEAQAEADAHTTASN